jgi:uncharacterized protein YdiU (UPF0061 family)
MAQWNLARLAEALLPLLSNDEDIGVEKAQEALAAFGSRFEQAYHAGLRRKLGLFTAEENDINLAGDVLNAMHQNKVDFTQFFRSLGRAAEGDDEPARRLFVNPSAFNQWVARWRERLAREAHSPADRRADMDSVNPAIIPRNHLIEAMIKSAVNDQNFSPFEELVSVLASPYEERPGREPFAQAPGMHERVTATFCGT